MLQHSFLHKIVSPYVMSTYSFVSYVCYMCICGVFNEWRHKDLCQITALIQIICGGACVIHVSFIDKHFLKLLICIYSHNWAFFSNSCFCVCVSFQSIINTLMVVSAYFFFVCAIEVGDVGNTFWTNLWYERQYKMVDYPWMKNKKYTSNWLFLFKWDFNWIFYVIRDKMGLGIVSNM